MKKIIIFSLCVLFLLPGCGVINNVDDEVTSSSTEISIVTNPNFSQAEVIEKLEAAGYEVYEFKFSESMLPVIYLEDNFETSEAFEIKKELEAWPEIDQVKIVFPAAAL